MDPQLLLPGTLVTVIVFGPFFLGAFRRHGPCTQSSDMAAGLKKTLSRWCGKVAEMKRLLTWKGILWAAALPLCWFLLFHTFVIHVRLSLGQWPVFNQRLEGWALTWHEHAVFWGGAALISPVYAAPVLLVVCLFFARWRHVSVYVVTYGVTAALATGSIYLAPKPFVIWFLD